MAAPLSLFLRQPPPAAAATLFCHSGLRIVSSTRLPLLPASTRGFLSPAPPLLFAASRRSLRRHGRAVCFSTKDFNGERPILQRWEVPWDWPNIVLTMAACGISFVLTGLVEQAALPYLGFNLMEASLDEKAEILFIGQFSVTAVVLGIIFSITNTFQPLSDDIFCYDIKDPFSEQRGWVRWAAVGLVGALIAIAGTGYLMSSLYGETPQRETDSLVLLLPLIGSSSVSTACLLGITGVLAPLLEETLFRGYLMVSLTKWVSTPVAVATSAAIFALAHLTPGEFPQLFVLGVALGLSYAQTRNLLTPITIHALWNSGVIVLLTVLQLQGYDIRELVQASS